MRALAEAHPDHVFVQQGVARLPGGHVVRRLENVKDVTRREWYARQAIEHGWSRNVLVHQIESNLYERQGKALTNFSPGTRFDCGSGDYRIKPFPSGRTDLVSLKVR
jgi:hypothetical protein